MTLSLNCSLTAMLRHGVIPDSVADLGSLAQPDSYTSGGGGRESGKVLYIELSQRLV